MSTHNTHASHGHDAHGTMRSYLTGFLLAVALTVIPFGIVMAGGIGGPGLTAAIVLIAAGVQIIVHMVYFLHLNSSSEKGWTMISLIFTVVILVIMLSGSVWVMFHMNANMMPMTGQM